MPLGAEHQFAIAQRHWVHEADPRGTPSAKERRPRSAVERLGAEHVYNYKVEGQQETKIVTSDKEKRQELKRSVQLIDDY